MNAPSPADHVEAALTPPWGPRLDHFLAARDEIKRRPPPRPPIPSARNTCSRGTGARTPRASLPRIRMDPGPKIPWGCVLVPICLR